MVMFGNAIGFTPRDVTPLRIETDVEASTMMHFSSFYKLSTVEKVEARMSEREISSLGASKGPFPIPPETLAYEPLPTPHSTRLFRLRWIDFTPIAPNTFDVTLHGEMQSFELDKIPPYRALSYTWASAYKPPFEPFPSLPTVQAFLECNGSILHITDNLFAALFQLGPDHYPGWIWIDAVCINQRDDQEKGHQIQLMNTIYSNATTVLGWLGGRHPFMSPFIWATTDFLLRYHQLQPEDLPLTYASLSQPRTSELFGVDSISDNLVAIWAFYNSCRWFSRAWVTQEVVLARNLVLILGGQEISWPALQDFTKVAIITGWRAQTCSQLHQLTELAVPDWLDAILTWGALPDWIDTNLHGVEVRDRLHGLEMASHPPGSSGRQLMCLHELLFLTGKFDCSVAVDRFYATIGLAGPEFKADMLRLTGATYQMKPREFYLNIATAAITAARYLDILVVAGITSLVLGDDGSGQGPSTWPSWVPTYIARREYQVFLYQTTAGLNTGLCSAETPTQRQFHVAGATLHCRGNLFDEVVETWDTRADEYTIDLLRMCKTFPPLIHGRPRFEVLWRTLLTDATKTSPRPRQNMPPLSGSILSTWMAKSSRGSRREASPSKTTSVAATSTCGTWRPPAPSPAKSPSRAPTFGGLSRRLRCLSRGRH